MADISQIHLGRSLDESVLDSLADFVCGDDIERFPTHRTSSQLTRFFQSVNVNATHDGTTRKWWVLEVLRQLTPPDLERVILRLVDLREYKADKTQLALAMRSMNDILAMDEFGVDYIGSRPVIVRAAPITITPSDLQHPSTPDPSGSEDNFLKQQFNDTLQVSVLGVDAVLGSLLQARIDEVQACPRDKVHLGTIFLLGSTLEGLLIGIAHKDLPRFMKAKWAPKGRDGTVKKVYDWKLAELIDVSQEIGVLSLDVKQFSHVLRDFRNYIHPYRQMSTGFTPDQHTIDICWQVFKAAFAQLKRSGI